MPRSPGLAVLTALLLLSSATLCIAKPSDGGNGGHDNGGAEDNSGGGGGGGVPHEKSGLRHVGAVQGPISVNWQMKHVDGSASLTINPDGSYLFSGQVKDKKPDHDYDISVALKSKAGILLFHYVGDDKDGVQWSEQGKSDVLKEDYSIFAANHDESWFYNFPLSAEGRADRYKQEKAKRDKLRREAHEAHEKHDASEAAKQAALRAEEQAEVQAELSAHHGGGGGGGVSGVVNDVTNAAASTVGTVVNTVGGAVSDILSLF